MATNTEAVKNEEAASKVEVLESEDMEAKALAEQRLEQAATIVRRKMLWSAGVGLVPVPVVDGAALLALQLYMIKQLCNLYGVTFKAHWIKNLVGGLLGSVLPAGLGGPLAYGLRYIPVIGYTTSALAFCGLGGAATYALGKLITNHLAKGGTLLSLDAEKLKAGFNKHFKEGQEVMASVSTAEPSAA